MRPFVPKDWLVAGALVLGGLFIFFVDLSPLQGADDGAAYGLVVALAAYFGRRQVIASAILGGVLTVVAPFVGGDPGESMLAVVSGRLSGLIVITIFTAVLLHLISTNATVAASDKEMDAYQQALSKITRLALSDTRPLLERFQIITELTTQALNAQTACVARVVGDVPQLRLYDVWDQRLGQHLAGSPTGPSSSGDEISLAIQNGGALAIEDLRLSPIHKDVQPFFENLKLRGLLHAVAVYRDAAIGSIVVAYEQPHRFSEREIAFAKSVAQVVALTFALYQSERTVQRLDYVSQGIFVLGQDGDVVYANLAARQLADSDDAAPPMPFALPPLLGVGDHHQIRIGEREYEIFRSRLAGEEILVRIDDVTARNVAMAEAAYLEGQLKESAKLEAMGQMAAGVAHDFNNILAAITGFALGLNRKLDGLTVERSVVERILGVCKKGQAMTKEILGFARTATVARDPIDLAALIASDLDEIQGECEGAAILSVQQPDGPLPIYGNPAQLTQLVQNLIVNATHACEGGDGRITVTAGRASREELRKLTAAAGRSQERLLGVVNDSHAYCYLRVADNGHGIPADVLDHIFEPFFTTKGRRKGSGLGLVIVHGVVDSHQGCCHVRSRPGEGTVFTIYLPLLAQEAIAAA
ncbi:MAG: ATP-binding protein [Rhizomicrobium sp.]|nr:ATP-binding protein [Rhizomicrobium sp.]